MKPPAVMPGASLVTLLDQFRIAVYQDYQVHVRRYPDTDPVPQQEGKGGRRFSGDAGFRDDAEQQAPVNAICYNNMKGNKTIIR